MLSLRVKRVLWDSSCAHCEALMARHSHRVQARTTCYTPAYARTAYCEAHKTATANKECHKKRQIQCHLGGIKSTQMDGGNSFLLYQT